MGQNENPQTGPVGVYLSFYQTIVFFEVPGIFDPAGHMILC